MNDQDFKIKTETTLALRDQLSQTHKLINRTDETIKQLTELKQRINSAGNESGVDKATQNQIDETIKKLRNYEDEILRRPPPNMGYRQRPRLKEEISELADAVDGATARPTQPQVNRLGELSQETDEATNQLNRIIEENINPINEKVKNLPQVITDKNKKL
jgi:ABC-type transporter Mla subunit MlaD